MKERRGSSMAAECSDRVSADNGALSRSEASSRFSKTDKTVLVASVVL
jgi:hypothetical protein